jgi:cell division protein ZapE
MNLVTKYNEAIAGGQITDDLQQRALIPFFQELMDALHKPQRHWFNWRKLVIKGIYLYGTVGAGKTFLMDLFFKHLHLHNRGKVRLHFHHFMQQIDGQLRRLQGKKNPLKIIANNMAQTTKILFLDEMLVNDVAQAMILTELFEELFNAGLILIMTSNTAPDDLYRNGVQRIRFLPVIKAIKDHCNILNLISQKDFRLHRKPLYQAYLSPLNAETEAILEQQFAELGSPIQTAGEILIEHREIPYLKRSEDAIWFDFNVICNLPRSQLDYLEITRRFSTLVVSNLAVLSDIDSAKSILFVNFIDVLYDQKIRLMISAEVPLQQLFGAAQDNFQRTYSRLQEMQSVDYSWRSL